MTASLDPVYLIHGEDRDKVGRALDRLIARVAAEGGLAPERFVAAESAVADVVAACETLAFGGRRLVIVSGLDEWRAADMEPIVAYLAAPNPDTCLALVGVSAPSGQRLDQAVRARGRVLAYGAGGRASRAEQRRWFARHFVAEVERLGGHVSERLAGDVVEALGGASDDARGWLASALGREAAKLVAYAGGEAITRADVRAVVVPHPDAPAYRVADALAQRDPPTVHRALADAGASHDRRSSATAIQWWVARHFRAIATIQDGGDASKGDQGLTGPPLENAMKHANALPLGVGHRAFARLQELEVDLRVSAFARLGRSPDDGGRFCWERAARDVLRDMPLEQGRASEYGFPVPG